MKYGNSTHVNATFASFERNYATYLVFGHHTGLLGEVPEEVEVTNILPLREVRAEGNVQKLLLKLLPAENIRFTA